MKRPAVIVLAVLAALLCCRHTDGATVHRRRGKFIDFGLTDAARHLVSRAITEAKSSKTRLLFPFSKLVAKPSSSSGQQQQQSSGTADLSTSVRDLKLTMEQIVTNLKSVKSQNDRELQLLEVLVNLVGF